MKCPICREQLEPDGSCLICGYEPDMPDEEVKAIKKALRK